MTRLLDRRSSEDLVRLFSQAAAENAKARRQQDDQTAIDSEDELTSIRDELRSRGIKEVARLARLLGSSDEGVRYWSAFRTLWVTTGEAEPVLAAIASDPSSVFQRDAALLLTRFRRKTVLVSCPACGAQILPDAVVCPVCESEVPTPWVPRGAPKEIFLWRVFALSLSAFLLVISLAVLLGAPPEIFLLLGFLVPSLYWMVARLSLGDVSGGRAISRFFPRPWQQNDLSGPGSKLRRD